MKLKLLMSVLSIALNSSVSDKKAVKIVQEPANVAGLQSPHDNIIRSSNRIPGLKPVRQAANFSGPSHFRKLFGKCFSLLQNSYLYELCPFVNFTQHEQSWRWNAFHGILGIWKEWSIINNTLESMVMTDGDLCPNGARRQIRIFVTCGMSDKLCSVKEPSTCKYEAELKTPLACPLDTFLVYPLLSTLHQEEWRVIERSFYLKEVTQQGYEKLRRKLFIRAGLMLSDGEDSIVSAKTTSLPTTVSTFKSVEECSQVYHNLQLMYDRLKQMVNKTEVTSSSITTQLSETSIKHSHHVNGARGDHGVIT